MFEQYRRLNDLMRCIDRRRKQICESTLAELDIQPSQHFMLVWLKHVGRMASQTKLAEMMQVSPAHVARGLKSLDKDGYIARSGGADSRCNEIEITAKGEGVLSESLQLFQQLDARSFAGFTGEELAQLDMLLGKYLNNLNQIRNEGEMNI